MTHTMRELNRPGSKSHNTNIVEGVTILECPKMVGVGLVGYQRTPGGLRAVSTIWASALSDEFRRRFYKNWHKAKKKAWKKHIDSFQKSKGGLGQQEREDRLKLIRAHCEVIRLIAHTRMKPLHIRQRKAHVMEIQINGGSVEDKINFGLNLFEKNIPVSDVFSQDEVIDAIA